jgi:hypothetical protein
MEGSTMPIERVETSLLDPFAFPPETRGRFVMLITAALACGANLGVVLHSVLVGNRDAPKVMKQIEYAIHQWRGRPVFNLGTADLKALAQQEAVISKAALLLLAENLILPCLMLLLLTALATSFYRKHPERLRLRYGTRALTKDESPMVVADLESCAERLGLSLPRLEYSSGLAQGHAFGMQGSEILLLHGTPAVLEKSWGEANRAIALHELAHIANADSQEREKAKSLWKAFVIMLLSGVVLLWAGGGRLTIIGLIQTIATLVFVRTLWAGLIRSREFYADWRVVSWGKGAILLSLLTLPEGGREPWERWNWWWAAWERWGDRLWWNLAWKGCGCGLRRVRWFLRSHPSFRERRKLLLDSSALFRISLDLPLLTGILLTLVMAGSVILITFSVSILGACLGLLHSMVLRLLADFPAAITRDLLLIGTQVAGAFFVLVSITAVILAPSYFITRTIGVQLQRNAMLGMVTVGAKSWGYARLLPVAFLLAIGMEIGLHIAPFNIVLLTNRETWVATPLWLMSFTVLLWLWLAYVHGLSRMYLGSYAGHENPKLRQAVVTWSSVALLAVLYWPAFLARLTLQLLPLSHARERMLLDIEYRKFFVYGLFAPTFVVLTLALSVYLVWVMATMAILRIGPLRAPKYCSTCGEKALYILSLGRRCRGCGEKLAPWIFTRHLA